MAGIEREYVCKAKWTMIVFCAMIFGTCAIALSSGALHNQRGLNFSGIIELSPGGATIFYWILCAFSVAGVGMAISIAINRLTTGPHRIAFTPTALLLPGIGWSGKEKAIAYQDIRALSVWQVSGSKCLYITHSGCREMVIASELPSKSAFNEIIALLQTKILHSQERQHEAN